MIPKIFDYFICKRQIDELTKREEEEEIKDKINKFEKIFNYMPVFNEQSNRNNAVIYLHYFKKLLHPSLIINWYIIEKDNRGQLPRPQGSGLESWGSTQELIRGLRGY